MSDAAEIPDVPDAPDAPDVPEGGGESADLAGAEGTQVPTEGEETATPPPEERRYTLRVNGKEVQLTEAEVIERAQKSEAAQRKFDEAAAMRKQVEHLIPLASRIEQDELVRALVSGDEATFYELLASRLEYEGLAPEDRAKVDADRELRRRAKIGEEAERRAAAERQQAQVQADTRELGAIATRELASVGISQDSPDFALAVERWAGEMSAALEAGVKLSPAAAAARVQEWFGRAKSGAIAELSTLEGDALLARMDELGLTERFRRADAARLETRRLGAAPAKGRQTAAPKAAEKRILTAGEIAKLARGIG